MKRIRAFAIVVSFVIFLFGCQSNKQADKIHKILEESTAFEKHFTTNLTDLFQTRENAQSVYMELIHLDINDKNNISEKIDHAYTFMDEQQKLLEEAQESFQKAYGKAATIEKRIKKIKDDDHKNEASKLITIMNERKKLIDTFFEDYHKNLQLQNAFYGQLKEETYNLETFNELIHESNERSRSMEEMIEQFNQYTEQYIKAEKDFYQMI